MTAPGRVVGYASSFAVIVISALSRREIGQPALGGYQLMVSAAIVRGRCRESLEQPGPPVPDRSLLYRFALPIANHVFLPGTGSWCSSNRARFPPDRNPQTFVPSIFWAKPGGYRTAVQRVCHAPVRASFVDLPLVTAP